MFTFASASPVSPSACCASGLDQVHSARRKIGKSFGCARRSARWEAAGTCCSAHPRPRSPARCSLIVGVKMSGSPVRSLTGWPVLKLFCCPTSHIWSRWSAACRTRCTSRRSSRSRSTGRPARGQLVVVQRTHREVQAQSGLIGRRDDEDVLRGALVGQGEVLLKSVASEYTPRVDDSSAASIGRLAGVLPPLTVIPVHEL